MKNQQLFQNAMTFEKQKLWHKIGHSSQIEAYTVEANKKGPLLSEMALPFFHDLNRR